MFVLEEMYKDKMNEHSALFNLRMQRSLSWLKKSIQLGHEWDLKFMSLCISFKALYKQEDEKQKSCDLQQFLRSVYQSDTDRKIDKILWDKYQQHTITLVENPYLHQLFWDYKHSNVTQDEWQFAFTKYKSQINLICKNHDSEQMLGLIFSCLSTLNHQMINGGVSANSAVYKKQIIECCHFMTALIHVFIFLLLEHKSIEFQKPYYPVAQVS